MKIALVTGGSSPMGISIAKKLAEENFKVFLASRNPEKTKEKNTISVELDVTDTVSCEKVVKEIIKKEKEIDVLVNVAGVSLASPVVKTSEEDYLNLLSVNTLGHFRLTKAVVPFMKKNKSGNIINITSLNGLVSLPNFGAYSSSKFAAEALGIALGYELRSYGIWVTNIAPGAIERKNNATEILPHRPLREKFKVFKILLPFTKDEIIADVVMRILKNSDPPKRVIVGVDAKLTNLIYKILPFNIWNKLVYFLWSRK